MFQDLLTVIQVFGNFLTVSELHWQQHLLLSLCAYSGSHYWWL